MGFLKVVALLAAGAISLSLMNTDLNPDAPWGHFRTHAVLVLFLLFAWWLHSFGRLCLRGLGWKREEAFLCLALGTLASVWIAQGAGFLGLLGPGFRPVLFFLMIAGILVTTLKPGANRYGVQRVSVELALAGALTIFSGARMIAALQPWGQVDPPCYHLLAARFWVEQGTIVMPSSFPNALLSGAWDDLYLWGQRLLAAGPGRGVIEAQLFCQLVHAVIGYGGAVLALFALGKALHARNREWLLVSVLGAVSVIGLTWTANLAKNDWGAIFWGISGLALWLSDDGEERSGSRAWVAGLLLGSAFAAKVSLAPWVASVLFVHPGRNRSLFLLGAAAAALPILGRNWLFTGNPLFPVTNPIFASSWMSDSFRPEMQAFSSARGSASPLWLLAAPALFLLFRERLSTARLALSTTLACIAFTVLTGEPEARLLGPALVLVPFVLLLTLGELLERRGARKPWLSRAVLAAALLAIVAGSDVFRRGSYGAIPLPAMVARLFEKTPPPLLIRNDFFAGWSRAWLRAHAKGGVQVATTGDHQHYYLSGVPVTSVFYQPLWDSVLSPERDERVILRFLRGYSVQYLLDSWQQPGRPWGLLATVASSWAERFPWVVAYGDAQSRVIDLEKLELALEDRSWLPDIRTLILAGR